MVVWAKVKRRNGCFTSKQREALTTSRTSQTASFCTSCHAEDLLVGILWRDSLPSRDGHFNRLIQPRSLCSVARINIVQKQQQKANNKGGKLPPCDVRPKRAANVKTNWRALATANFFIVCGAPIGRSVAKVVKFQMESQ